MQRETEARAHKSNGFVTITAQKAVNSNTVSVIGNDLGD